ncbi:MAG TPA: glycosyltransferase family 39 protein [Phycisphaerae bacterium]|nr:glycosyltransferase family 39 protein [Phycisphaerae bacterium]
MTNSAGKTETTTAALQNAATPPKLRRGCDVAAVLLAIGTLAMLWSLRDKPVTWPSDHFSDMHALMSGKNFAEHGFFRLRFLPVNYLGDIGDNPFYYLHYPPLPNVANGVLRVVGVDSLAGMRMVSSLLFVLGLYAMYRAFAPIIGPLAAVCGMGFLSLSSYTISYGMSLHTHAYNLLFLGLFLWLLRRAIDDEGLSARRRKATWAGCWAVLVLASLTSFEFIMYAQVFAWLYVLATGRFRARWPALVLLGTAPVFGVAVHFLQNIWAVGWTAAWADKLGFGFWGDKSRWGYSSRLPDLLLSYSLRAYHWPWTVLPVLGVACLLLAERSRLAGVNVRRASSILLACMLAPLAWYLFLPGHIGSHPHTANQMLPLAWITIGGAVGVAAYALGRRATPWPLRIVSAVAVIAVLQMQLRAVSQQISHGSTLPTTVMAEALGKADILPDNVAVVFNTAVAAQFAYYIERPAWRCPSQGVQFPDALPELRKHVPERCELKYYVFFGPPGQQYMDVFQYLASRCPGRLIQVPGLRNPQRYIILFDITELHRPPQERRPLDPRVKEAQLRGGFTPWDIPNFAQLVQQAWTNQTGQ